MNKKFTILIVILGMILTANAIIITFVSNFNIGNIISLTLGVGTILYGLYREKINKMCNKGIFKLIKIFVIIGIATLFGIISIIVVNKITKVTSFNEDAVIILGCGIDGDKVRLGLAKRLDKGVEYLEENKAAIIIVSGGQGQQETITEALAMERYLVSKGVPKEQIIKEEKATSTYENFKYSKEILDNAFKGSYRVTYITNEYHSYRAGMIAKELGMEANSYTSNTKIYLLPSTYTREVLAVIKFWIFLR